MKYSLNDTPETASAAIRTFLSAPSAIILITASVIAWAIRFSLAAWSWADLIVAAATLLFWPVLEWLIHVYILHSQPTNAINRLLYKIAARDHHNHHVEPWDLKLVFIPMPAFLVAPLLLGFYWLITPSLAVMMTGLAVYYSLAINYEWSHYLAHIRWRCPIPWYQKRVTMHRAHHFKNEQLWWGVSMLSGDKLFGTDGDPRTAPQSDDPYTVQ